MDPLLARQIRRHLSDQAKNDPSVQKLLQAVAGSYQNYKDQLSMLHRAMSISSEELFDANQKLKKEAQEQRKVISSLNAVINTLESLIYQDKNDKTGKVRELNGIQLVNHIQKQAIQISETEKQRELILKNLEKSNQELKDYAHVVSHDLKSPLRNISTLIHWIKSNDGVDHTICKNLDLIDKNVQKMDNLIQGILEYSSIDQVKKVKTNISIQQIVEEVLEQIHVPDHIQIKIDGKLPIVYGNKLRLVQLFQNLINNAIKYNDKNKGLITISHTEKGSRWQFSVKDNGSGIPEKYHEKIFQIFQTLDTTNQSTGIGLSIVKKIIDNHNGVIWLESQEGIGTTFYFTLKK